jgi:hypothetical protein
LIFIPNGFGLRRRVGSVRILDGHPEFRVGENIRGARRGIKGASAE